MKVSDVAARLAPFAAIINKNALSPNYKALVLSPTHVRAASPLGAMSCELALGLTSEVALEGDALLSIVRSLNPSAELEVSVAEGSLRWRSGAARGQLALMGGDVVVPPPQWGEDVTTTEVGPGFTRGLDLGSLACGTTALLSVGLYGVHVANSTSGLVAYASDNVTISRARLSDHVAGSADFFTLSPDGVTLLGLVVARGRAAVSFDATTVYCETPDTRLVLKQVPALKTDLRGIADTYLGEEVRLPLNRDIISSFIRRTEALSEERGRAAVTLSISEGALRLAFSEGRASSEEYYLAEGCPAEQIEPLTVDTRRLGRALTHASHVVFDYTKRNALVLRGEGEFAFVISARTPTP